MSPPTNNGATQIAHEDDGDALEQVQADLNFELSIPDPHDRGYIGFVDDLSEMSRLLNKKGDFRADDWDMIRDFLLSRISRPEDDGEKYDVVRSMSMDDFAIVLQALMNEVNSDAKKNNSQASKGRSTMRSRASKTTKTRRPRGRGASK